MAETATLTESTGTPPESGGTLPQMDVTTFPSQLFWLVLTFGFLFVVLSRVAVPRIGGVIEARRDRINNDLETAEKLRKESNDALAAYESSLTAARGRAMAMADENRKKIAGDTERLKAEADADAQRAIGTAEARIAAMRASAEANVHAAAADAAIAIVERLIGDKVSADEAVKAVPNLKGRE